VRLKPALEITILATLNQRKIAKEESNYQGRFRQEDPQSSCKKVYPKIPTVKDQCRQGLLPAPQCRLWGKSDAKALFNAGKDCCRRCNAGFEKRVTQKRFSMPARTVAGVAMPSLGKE
jgi:hypothetical protein